MLPKAAIIVRKMKRGLKLREKKEEEKIEAGGIKIVTKGGIQIPMGYPFPYPPPPPKEKKPEKPEGIEISPALRPRGKPVKLEEEKESLKGINIKYPLIPSSPKKGEKVFAYTNIVWQKEELGYLVIEPPLAEGEKKTIEKIKRNLEERLDIDFTKLGEIKAKQVLREEIQKSFSIVPEITEERKSILTYYIERDLIGLGKIETLMRDPNIEDISCDGVGIPLYVFHRDPRFASMRTNIVFETVDELNSFVGMLAQKCNKTISIAEPLLDGALPDGSRVQATLGTDIARKGSNFTIRKFTEKPLTPTHMLKFKTLDSTQLAYLWLAIENGKSILVSGGTATGKTSLLNALSLFIRPTLKVVSIEDTAELRLPLPHWIPHVARTPLSIKGTIGEVTLFDLLKSSLRQRPDYIIVGEVRGKEAFVLFQQMATGHPSLATIHAASIPQLIDRLITPPISLPPSLLENIDIVIFLTFSRLKGSYVRRADNILEVTGIRENRPETAKIFEWKPVSDVFEVKEKSIVLKKTARRLGITEESIQEELARRKKILEWMLEKEIFDYREVARVISAYYHDPERVIDAAEAS
jgi:flagellar protein FlaI